MIVLSKFAIFFFFFLMLVSYKNVEKLIAFYLTPQLEKETFDATLLINTFKWYWPDESALHPF